MDVPEEYNHTSFEASLGSLNQKGPFTLWSGKGESQRAQFPPEWGHAKHDISTIQEAMAEWCGIVGETDQFLSTPEANYYDKPYVVDNAGNVVLSTVDPEASEFARWLIEEKESGGILPFLRRNGFDIDT